MTLARSTRKNIVDWLRVEKVPWSGRLDDIDFLERLFALDELPSSDARFKTARTDIWQHRVNNYDWEDDWVYSDDRFGLLKGDDETLLRFLCEMVHPVVRPDTAAATTLVAQLNDFLRDDGFELVESTRIGEHPVWAARRRSLAGAQALSGVRHARAMFDADYISQQITRMEAAVEPDPALAIGTAKELVEATCKAILDARSVPIPNAAELPKLVRLVTIELDLVPEGISEAAKASETVRHVLGALGTVVDGIAKLRNAYGTGHGQAPRRGGLTARHAKLAVGAGSTLSVFLYETHQQRKGPASAGNQAISGG
jgi:hypothetical protein